MLTTRPPTKAALYVAATLALVAGLACGSAETPGDTNNPPASNPSPQADSTPSDQQPDDSPTSTPSGQAPSDSAASTPEPAETPATGNAQPQQGSVIVAMKAVGTPIFVPTDAIYPQSYMQFLWGIQENLVMFGTNEDGEEVEDLPMLATSWEVASDMSKVTFNLREGVPFRSYGEDWGPMTADDVVWSINQAGAENASSRHAAAAEIRSTFMPWVKVDEYTVEAPFRNYRGDFLSADTLSNAGDSVGIFSKAVFEEFGVDKARTTPHGTGPFVVREWLPNESIEMESVTEHWRIVPSFAEITLIEAPEASIRTAMLQTGEADIAPVSVADVPTLEAEGIVFNEGLRQYRGQVIHLTGNWWMNEIPSTGEPLDRPLADRPWIGDPYEMGEEYNLNTPSMDRARKVRKALSMSIDRDLIANTILAGYGTPLYANVHPSHPGWKERWKIPFDPEQAQQLMQEANYADGFSLTFWCPADVGGSHEVCLSVAGMWQKHLNVHAEMDVTKYGAYRPRLVGRTFTDAWMQGWGPGRDQAELEPGGTEPGCCLWAQSGGTYNLGHEIPEAYASFQETRTQERGSEENLQSIEEFRDFWYEQRLSFGAVDVPTLIGVNPDKITSWNLLPLATLNNFESIKVK